MGVYHYTLRKKAIKTLVLGREVPIHAFSYAFKYHYNPEDERRAQFICDNAARVWENQPLPEFAFIGDMPTKEEKAAGASKGVIYHVYDQLKNHGWDDCNKFPGRWCGFLTFRQGKPVFLTAKDGLIEEWEHSIACMPDQPAKAGYIRRVEYLLTLPETPGLVDVYEFQKAVYEATKEVTA